MCRVPVDSPERFRVEILFSPGASHNPFEVVPLKQDHTLPVLPRMPLHAGEARHTDSRSSCRALGCMACTRHACMRRHMPCPGGIALRQGHSSQSTWGCQGAACSLCSAMFVVSGCSLCCLMQLEAEVQLD